MSINFYLSLLISLFLTLNSFAQNKNKTAEKDTTPLSERQYKDACKLIDSAKYKDALPLLKKAVKEKKDFWQAFNKMALVNLKLEKYKDAEKDIDKSNQIMPGNYETQKLKGMTQFYLNNFKECKITLDTALSIMLAQKIDDAEIYYYRAMLMYKGKSNKNAIESCESAIELNPKYIDAFILKAEIRFSTKEYNHALKELNDAIKLMSDGKISYQAYKLRAKTKFELKDFKGAVTDWSVYIDATPNDEEALVSRGAARINNNDNTNAIVDLDEAIKINKKNPVAYCYRGVAKAGNKQYPDALKDFDTSIKLKFDYAAAYLNRAATRMASKDKQGACDDLNKADGLGDEMAMKLIEKYCKGR
ncbi:MAG: hypothetical protein JSU07_14205 [Bacteroidetes bacterium]|nr:hypothetical protein [Bacteroidota bacterium]